jgi:hypothetical protein
MRNIHSDYGFGGLSSSSQSSYQYLGGLQYQANKEEMISYAESRGADIRFLMMLDTLPEDYSFDSVSELNYHLGIDEF